MTRVVAFGPPPKNIARLTEFDSQDRHASVLHLTWQAREYLSDAERSEEVSFVMRIRWCEQAATALEAARSLLMFEKVPVMVALDLLARACSAAKAAAANGVIAESYDAVNDRPIVMERARAILHTEVATRQPSDWERQHVSKAIAIFKRAAETGRQETHRALVELCELFPDAMPTEE